MLDRVSGPYAICMEYYPEYGCSIKGAILKYGNEASVEEYARAIRSCYLDRGFESIARHIIVFSATEDEIVQAMSITGDVAAIYERKLKDAGLANPVATQKNFINNG